MNRRQIVLLVAGVVAIHVFLFWWIAGSVSARSISRKAPPDPEKDSFKTRIYELTDSKTGERYLYKEFQVSTKLALPDVLMEPEKRDPPGKNPYRMEIFPLPLGEFPKRE